MKKSPGFWFFTGDWLKDPELRFCSIFARGLLVDLLCYMFEAKEQGFLVWADGTPRTDQEIVDAISGGSDQEKLSALSELVKKGVLSRDSRGALFSRRLSKLKELSEIRRKNGSKGGSKKVANNLAKLKQKRGVTDTVSVSVTDSVSVTVTDSELNTNSCPEPSASRPKEVDERYSFPVKGGKKTWCCPVDLVARFEETYDTIDIHFQIRAAMLWIESKPERAKTAKGMPAFLNSWIMRAVDNPKTPRRQKPRTPTDPDDLDSFIKNF